MDVMAIYSDQMRSITVRIDRINSCSIVLIGLLSLRFEILDAVFTHRDLISKTANTDFIAKIAISVIRQID